MQLVHFGIQFKLMTQRLYQKIPSPSVQLLRVSIQGVPSSLRAKPLGETFPPLRTECVKPLFPKNRSFFEIIFIRFWKISSFPNIKISWKSYLKCSGKVRYIFLKMIYFYLFIYFLFFFLFALTYILSYYRGVGEQQ